MRRVRHHVPKWGHTIYSGLRVHRSTISSFVHEWRQSKDGGCNSFKTCYFLDQFHFRHNKIFWLWQRFLSYHLTLGHFIQWLSFHSFILWRHFMFSWLKTFVSCESCKPLSIYQTRTCSTSYQSKPVTFVVYTIKFYDIQCTSFVSSNVPQWIARVWGLPKSSYTSTASPGSTCWYLVINLKTATTTKTSKTAKAYLYHRKKSTLTIS